VGRREAIPKSICVLPSEEEKKKIDAKTTETGRGIRGLQREVKGGRLLMSFKKKRTKGLGFPRQQRSATNAVRKK